MNGESKKDGDFAQALSNLMYTALMGTARGRGTTTGKSKYCFESLGSFSSCHLTGSSSGFVHVLSLLSLSWFLVEVSLLSALRLFLLISSS